MTGSRYVTIYMPRKQAEALLEAANRHLTDDPNTQGRLNLTTLDAATDTLAAAIQENR